MFRGGFVLSLVGLSNGYFPKISFRTCLLNDSLMVTRSKETLILIYAWVKTFLLIEHGVSLSCALHSLIRICFTHSNLKREVGSRWIR